MAACVCIWVSAEAHVPLVAVPSVLLGGGGGEGGRKGGGPPAGDPELLEGSKKCFGLN